MGCLSLSLPTCWRRRNNKRCVRDDLLLIEINSGQQMRPFRHKDTGQLRGTTWYIPSMYPAESLKFRHHRCVRVHSSCFGYSRSSMRYEWPSGGPWMTAFLEDTNERGSNMDD